MWSLPGPGIEPMFPTLAGGFLTTTPPGKFSALNSFLLHFFCCESSPYIVSLYGAHWLSIFLSFSFGSSIWMLSTNLSSNTLILFSFSFPCSSLLLNLCWILQFTHCIVHVKLPQSCPTLCDPMDCSPPGSSVHSILPASILKWVAMHSAKGSSRPRNRTRVSYISCTCRQVLYH